MHLFWSAISLMKFKARTLRSNLHCKHSPLNHIWNKIKREQVRLSWQWLWMFHMDVDYDSNTQWQSLETTVTSRADNYLIIFHLFWILVTQQVAILLCFLDNCVHFLSLFQTVLKRLDGHLFRVTEKSFSMDKQNLML